MFSLAGCAQSSTPSGHVPVLIIYLQGGMTPNGEGNTVVTYYGDGKATSKYNDGSIVASSLNSDQSKQLRDAVSSVDLNDNPSVDRCVRASAWDGLDSTYEFPTKTDIKKYCLDGDKDKTEKQLLDLLYTFKTP